jgi:toxin YoeB
MTRGIGMPEALRENLSGVWSRWIDDANGLSYVMEAEPILDRQRSTIMYP